MAQTILGIDIGSYSIKIAEIERSFKSFEFVNFYERKIQYNELLKAEESVSVTLQGMIDDFDLKWDQVICGYPGEKTASRLIQLPFGNLKKIGQTLEFELEGYIPFDLESLVVDYHVVRVAKESSDVLAFYTLKADFTKWLEFLQNCKVDPKVITVEGAEFLNLVSLGMVPPEGPFCILDIGHSKTNLIICKGKSLAFIRPLTIGGKHITEGIQKKLGVPSDEAERLKIEMGGLIEEGSEIYDDLSKQVGEALKEVVDELILNIRQALFAFRDQAGGSVEGVYLCGGTSRLPGLDRYLSKGLKQNVTHIDCTSFYFSHLRKVTTHRAMMAQGLALALRSVASGNMPAFNFRQGEFAFKGDMEKIGGTLRHVAIAISLIVVLGFTYFGVKHATLSKQIKNLNGEILAGAKKELTEKEAETIKSPDQFLNFLKRRKNEMKKTMEKLSQIEGIRVLDLIREISKLVPGRDELKLDIDGLSFKGEELKIEGITDSLTSVDTLLNSFKNKPDNEPDRKTPFQEIEMGQNREINQGETKFEMTLNLKAKEEKKPLKKKGGKS